jgi:hypothetical protein
MRQLSNLAAKKYFEGCYRERISDRTWYRYKSQILRSGLDLTKGNLHFLAKFKRDTNRSIGTFNLPIILRIYQEKFLEHDKPIKGNTVYCHLRTTTTANPTTIYRWFGNLPPESLQGYSKDRLYTPQELAIVFLQAELYKFKQIKKVKRQCNYPKAS